MKIHMEAVTLLSVLFATATTSSVSAADDTQQGRQLGPKKRMKKSSKTNAPTNIEPTSLTLKLRVVLDDIPTVVAAVTVGPPDFTPVPSFIGSTAITTGRVFLREMVPVDEDGNLFDDIPSDPEGTLLYTSLCTITSGRFPNSIERNNCDFSLCFEAPLIGGCTYYKSGGNFPFTIGQSLPPTTATKIGGNGVLGFDTGPAFLSLFSAGSTLAFDLDVTRLIPIENIERNLMLANTVPGFCPPEAGSDPVCLNGFPEDFQMPPTRHF
jgi:hypothetical protein